MDGRERVMRTLRFENPDRAPRDLWALPGIEMFRKDELEAMLDRFPLDLAREMGASEAVAHAILCHNQAHGIPLETKLDKALFCADPLTGLITAAALVRPDQKLAGVEARSIRKRFKEKGFAAGASREQIARCSELGLELDEFIELGLKAMQGIASQLGL